MKTVIRKLSGIVAGIAFIIALQGTVSSCESAPASKPNVIIVITDDQGYGDMAFTGNPAIKTPTIDNLC